MTSRTLVVCGDDLGLHPAINAGIFRSHEAGVMRAASLVVAGQAVDEALRYSRDHAGLDVGVHLALLDVQPVGDPAPWRGLLDQRGCFPPSAAGASLARLAWWVTRYPDAALAEFDAQLRRAAELGVRVTHADGHNHLHLLPPVIRGVVRLCRERGVPWLRVPRTPMRRLTGRRWSADRGGIKGTLVRVAGHAATRHLRTGAPRMADHLLGLGLHGGRVTVARTLELAGKLQPGVTEWMAHPAVATRELVEAYPWGHGWGQELVALCDPRFRDALERNRVRVAGFSAL